jgi:hypothetical protein
MVWVNLARTSLRRRQRVSKPAPTSRPPREDKTQREVEYVSSESGYVAELAKALNTVVDAVRDGVEHGEERRRSRAGEQFFLSFERDSIAKVGVDPLL